MPILDGGILQVAGLHCEQCTDYFGQINTLFAVESRSSFVSNWLELSLYSFHRTIHQFFYVCLHKGLSFNHDSSNCFVRAGPVRPIACVLFYPAVNAR